MASRHLQQVRFSLVRSARPEFTVRTPADVAEAFQDLTSDPRESFYALYLNGQNEVICFDRISTGNSRETITDPAEIIRTALLCAARSLVFVHNHPSGNPCPSQADQQVTQQISQAAALFHLTVIDHVIIGSERRYYSFLDRGLLPKPAIQAPATPAPPLPQVPLVLPPRPHLAPVAAAPAAAFTRGQQLTLTLT